MGDEQGPKALPVVLVVDSDESIAEAFRDAAAGIEVVIQSASDPSRVWSFLCRQVPAAIFSDLRVAGTDGLALLEQVGTRFPSLMRVLYTAEAAPPRGVDIPVLGKPCTKDALRDLLAAVALLAGERAGSFGPV